VNKDKAYKNVC